MSPFSQDELDRMAKLALIGLFGMLAWVSNHLFHGRHLPIGRFIGGLLGAMIASVSVVGIINSMFDKPSVELSFGVAGIVGWVGGNSLARIFQLLEDKLITMMNIQEDTDGRGTE